MRMKEHRLPKMVYIWMSCVTLLIQTGIMLNRLKKDINTVYKDILLDAFPKTLGRDVEAVLNILPFDVDDVKLADGQFYKVDNLIHSSAIGVQLENELLTIPQRIYFIEPDREKEMELTDRQQTILNCIYLRHHDGYLRQRRLENLSDKTEYWVTPFTIGLLGEYVYEILQILDKQINDKTIGNYERFVKENSKYWQQTEHRMISYWNEYYRQQFPKLKDYLGQRLVERIKNQTRNLSLPKHQNDIPKFNVGNPKYDFSDLAGKLQWRGDAVVEQRRMRDEW